MPNFYENETKIDEELIVASQKTTPVYYPQIIGQFAGGSPTDYGNPRLKEIHVAPGQDIQKAINALDEAGGGIIRLLSGTHYPNKNIIVKSNIFIEGEGIETTVLDFNSKAFNLQFVGTLRTEVGTITATEGSATISGSSTSFTNYSVDDILFVTASNYNFVAKIIAIASDTSLTIEDAWPMPTVSGSSAYSVFDSVKNGAIKNLSIKNSAHTTASLEINRVVNFICENVFVYNNTVAIGISIKTTIDSEFRNTESSYNGSGIGDNGFDIALIKRTSFYNCSAIGNEGGGFLIVTLSRENAFYSCVADGNSEDGFYSSVAADDNFYYNCIAKGNDGNGFDMAADRSLLVGCIALDNGVSGIVLESDDNLLINCRLINNDSYGIDNRSGASRNQIIAPYFSGNSSGTILDDGTNLYYSNSGYGTFTAANGANNNIDVGENRIVRISGPTAAFNITGVTNTANAKSVILYNTTTQNMTITDQAISDDTQQILTGTGTDVATTGMGQAGLYYDATDKKWILVGING